MRITAAAFLVAVLLMWTVPDLVGQSSPAQTWNLPQGSTVKDSGPRTYRFTVDYNTANTKGEVVHRQRVTGDYTRGLPANEVVWKNVTVADAIGSAAFASAAKRDFMEGFRYRNDLDNSMKPDFFKTFPATAVVERNLVWDTGMLEMFGQNYFDQLKLNEPYHPMSKSEDVAMPNVGRFHLRDVVLERIGRSQRNGQECALIRYQAFFNPLEIVNGGMTLKGRSDFWGEIWVSIATRQIEYGTLYEVVVGEMKLPGQDTTQVINVFRNGILEPVNVK